MYKKKVLHIVSVSFSLKYFIGNQFKYFKEKGYDFTVACSSSEELFEYSKEMNFRPFALNISRSISPLNDIISIYKLYKFIRKEKFDIVISHSPKGGLIGMIASFLAKSPKRFFFRHGLVFETEKGFKRNILIFVEKIIALCSHKVINVSKSIEKESNFYKLNTLNKNILLGKGTCNGVNENLFLYKNKSEYKDKIVIGYIGRLSKDKGIQELIDSLQYIKSNQDFLLLLIGPLDERDKLPGDSIEIIHNHPNIKYLGEKRNISYYYNQMDIFILPSYREGFPTVNLEASSSSLPIITSRKTGCIDSIIENETGIFTDINPKSIACSIDFYIQNEGLRIEHGKNGREFVLKYFTEQRVYQEIEKKLLK